MVSLRLRSRRCKVVFTASTGMPVTLASQRESARKPGRPTAEDRRLVLDRGVLGDLVRRQPQPPSERLDVASRQTPLAAKDLRQRRVIDRQRARERAQRVARVDGAAAVELRLQHGAKGHDGKS